jgi:hypothetical protein
MKSLSWKETSSQASRSDGGTSARFYDYSVFAAPLGVIEMSVVTSEIGTKAKYQAHRAMSEFGGKAEGIYPAEYFAF